MIIVGIDPGKDGGIAVLGPQSGTASVQTMPVIESTKGRDEYDVAGLRGLLCLLHPDHVVIEKLQPMPIQKGGTIANFMRGASGHLLIGLCAGLQLPFTLVAPQRWQKVMLAGTPGEDTKQRSVLAAQRLFPAVSLLATPRCRKPHDGMSDALLIAEYGRRLLEGHDRAA